MPSGGTKRISQGVIATGLTVYMIVRFATNLEYLNDADGAFAVAPVDPYVSLTENSVMKGLYEVAENRTVWSDGDYDIVIYKQNGASPSPISDTMVGIQKVSIRNDLLLNLGYIYSAAAASTSPWDQSLSAHTTTGTAGAFMGKIKSQFGLSL